MLGNLTLAFNCAVRRVGRAVRIRLTVVIGVVLVVAWPQSDVFPSFLGINFVDYLLLIGVGAVAYLNGWIRDGAQ